jgi:glutathione reductase (NADPH)
LAIADGVQAKLHRTVPAAQERHYAEAGIDTLRGHARFTGRNAVDVDGTTLIFNRALIATGNKPAPLGILGEEHVATNDAFLELDVLPKRIALIGGGYLAAEFSHIAARADSQVTILQQRPRLLPRFDAELVFAIWASTYEPAPSWTASSASQARV